MGSLFGNKDAGIGPCRGYAQPKHSGASQEGFLDEETSKANPLRCLGVSQAQYRCVGPHNAKRTKSNPRTLTLRHFLHRVEIYSGGRRTFQPKDFPSRPESRWPTAGAAQ